MLLLLIAGCATATGNDCLNRLGDVDGDGFVVPADASLALDISLGIYAPTECEREAADFDGNGTVTAQDADDIFSYWLNTP